MIRHAPGCEVGDVQQISRPLATSTPAAPAALAGVLAAALALGIGHLVATATGAATSPLITVGGVLIDAAPQAAKAFAIETFGTNDKIVLVAGIAMALAVVAGVLGILAARRPVLGLVGIVAFGVVGVAAALTRPFSGPVDVLPAIVGAAAAFVALRVLLSSIARTQQVAPAAAVAPSTAVAQPGRRTFLGRAAGVAALAVGSGVIGAVLQGRRGRVDGADVALPAVVDPAPSVDPATDLGVVGISPFVTSNADFYRVDIALVPPVLDVAAWSLRIHGMVEREVTLTFAELIALPLVERDLTLSCVSNQVGGPYVGNARWTGVRLADVLAEAGVQAGRGAAAAADQLVSRGADGMTIGTPTAIALDGRDAILAVAMNGEPLPVDHGYPVRMIVPGLFGYVSATKWLTELELTTFDTYDAYWVERGWAAQAPVRTMSRIDTPRPLATLAGGSSVQIGGVAWAQHRGITRVEVRVDDGPWREARLGAVDSIDTWRQWSIDWAPTPGRHSLSVRATDGSGSLQPEERAEPFPSGATGWHTVVVTAQ